MEAAVAGRPVDRVPIWLREGFDFHLPLARADDFTMGWKKDPGYVELFEFAKPYCDDRAGWSPGGHFNRMLGVPPHVMRAEHEQDGPDRRRTTTTIDTPGGELVQVTEQMRGEATSWTVKPAVETLDDLDRLRRVPFEVDPVSYDDYERTLNAVGDRGVVSIFLSSPWVVFSTVTTFEQALMWSATERAMVHEVLQQITDRACACLDAVLERPLDTHAVIGGSEQCTPPMMSPDAFAEFVTPYEKPLVDRLRAAGIPVWCHCHGRVRYALPEIEKIGYSVTEPVEPPEYGGGDLSMAEARAAVDDRLTLCGNLQFEELERCGEDHIRRRVREIVDTGKDRLILAASAGPTSRPSERMLRNYRAWIEEAVGCGG